MSNDNAERVNLYDSDKNLWGCFYPATCTLVKRDRKSTIEMDLTPFLRVDKTKTDSRQNENLVIR